MKYIESTGLIETLHMHDGPMCPQGMPFNMHPMHVMANRAVDVAYEAIERDEDDEPIDPAAGKVGYALSYGTRMQDRMLLYRHTVSVMSHASGCVAVETIYFQCQICGFTLPANRVP